MARKINPDAIKRINEHIKEHGLRKTASTLGVATNTLKSAAAGNDVSKNTFVKLGRLPARTRKREDFQRGPRIRPPRSQAPALSWSIESIRAAIEAQVRGEFASPVRLAEAMRRDDAIYVARDNRIAPIRSVASTIRPYASDLGRTHAKHAATSIHAPGTVLAGLLGTLVDHAISIGYVDHDVNATGTRVDLHLTEWPLEHVRWDSRIESLVTATEDGDTVPITHGDGRWIVFRYFARHPWRQNACILPAGFVWAAHAEGIADWQSSSKAHGLAKIVGALPEGTAINESEDDDTTTLAQEFTEMIEALADGSEQVGLRPAGSEVEFLANASNAWEVFAKNIESREKAAARIYLGTDATLGSVGGAPGVDISELFGVATTKLQGDFRALQAGLQSGLYEPWEAINYGSTKCAPTLEFLLPDPDREKQREQAAANRERLAQIIGTMREQRLQVNQEVVTSLATELGVLPVPILADAQSASIALAPTDIAKVVRVREARAAQGLPPFGDTRDEMTIAQLDAWAETQGA